MPVFIVVLLAFDKRNLYHKKQHACLRVSSRAVAGLRAASSVAQRVISSLAKDSVA